MIKNIGVSLTRDPIILEGSSWINFPPMLDGMDSSVQLSP